MQRKKLMVNNSFEFSAFEINEVPQSILIANALLEKMCE